ncbi:NAD(P)/FAD-dependent oxidoreductase [Mesonia sp. MT50]|uniref:NADH:ubiquinone reductase (non-electrogenic) n=1 Tax=Mesonia profundi TaxID=3070998 RepID=A0ABU1A2A2_9FLAO|nr:NAD(P)/FAD-dependent oxidoreductase [Mesonia profundi]MDQ7917759.1 NAD(P)/FAD-dependent oxidoreductase [Mesonia profundi]
MNIPNTKQPRIVIVGGGFAGIHLLRKLIKTKKFQLVLIDKHNYHSFQPLLYQVSTSGLEPDSIAYPLRKIITSVENAYFRLTEVTSIDAKNSTLHSTIGELTYDYLVIATGSKTNFFGNKSIEKNGMAMKTIPQALNIRSLILQNLEKATITTHKEEREALLNFVIAGAGPTGVELSGAIAEVRNNIVPKDYIDIQPSEIKIHLLEGLERVLPPMSEKASAKAKKFLEELGVEIHLNTMVEDYDGEVVNTNKGDRFKTKTFIWSAGVTGAPVKGLNANALVERANRYNVNVFNQVEGYENVFAIGDIALMKSEKYPKGHPMVAQPAIQQGENLAKNLIKIQKGEKLKPFSYFDKGTMATIGRNKAVVDLKRSTFGGFFAWFIWMFVHLWFLVGFRNRIVTFFNWTYNYINFDRAARLIIRPFRGGVKNEDLVNPPEEEEEE